MLHVVLFQPQIPQNTGNIGRMCAITRSRLHLIHPLGYKITDAALRRAGMDYWFSLDVHQHADWAAFKASEHAPKRMWLIETGPKRKDRDEQFGKIAESGLKDARRTGTETRTQLFGSIPNDDREQRQSTCRDYE